MSNEITCTLSLSFTKTPLEEVSRSMAAFNVDVAGSKYHQSIQNIGTSEEAISKADLGNLGWAWFHNLDATNWVEIRGASGAADLIRIPPGKACILPLAPDATPWAIANASAVNLEVFLIEA